IRGIINLIQNPGSGNTVWRLAVFGLAIIALVIVKQAIDSTRNYQMAVLDAKVTFRLRGKLFDKLLSLSLSELGEMKSGGITSRLAGDVDNVGGLVQQAIISPGVAGMRIIIFAGLLFWMSWRLALTAAIAFPPLAAISFLWLRRVRPIYRSI